MDKSEKYHVMVNHPLIQQPWKDAFTKCGEYDILGRDFQGEWYRPPRPLNMANWKRECWDSPDGRLPCLVGAEYHYSELWPTPDSLRLPSQSKWQERLPPDSAAYLSLPEYRMDPTCDSWEQAWAMLAMYELFKLRWADIP